MVSHQEKQETKSIYFLIPFDVFDINYFILGTPPFEKFIKNINIQDSTMNFKHSSFDQTIKASFTTLIEKELSFFSFLYQKANVY